MIRPAQQKIPADGYAAAESRRWTDMTRFAITLLASLSSLTSAWAFASDRLSPPDQLDHRISADLESCRNDVVKVEPTGNQLVAAGFKSCYSGAMVQWNNQIEKAKYKLSRSVDHNCKILSDAVEEKWRDFRKEALRANGLGDLPLNTDDALEIRILKNLYEINYDLTENFACKEPKTNGK